MPGETLSRVVGLTLVLDLNLDAEGKLVEPVDSVMRRVKRKLVEHANMSSTLTYQCELADQPLENFTQVDWSLNPRSADIASALFEVNVTSISNIHTGFCIAPAPPRHRPIHRRAIPIRSPHRRCP